jgi:hypothetical protein
MKYLTTIILLTFLNATAMAKEIKTEILINPLYALENLNGG